MSPRGVIEEHMPYLGSRYLADFFSWNSGNINHRETTRHCDEAGLLEEKSGPCRSSTPVWSLNRTKAIGSVTVQNRVASKSMLASFIHGVAELAFSRTRRFDGHWVTITDMADNLIRFKASVWNMIRMTPAISVGVNRTLTFCLRGQG